MKKHLLIVGIILLFIFSSVTPLVFGVNIQISKIINDGDTLYVGGSGLGNYSKIQDAIDDASDGDTVFVYDDSSPYYGHVKVNKNINLIGENKDTTIISIWENDIVIEISADGVYISGFTIQHGSKSGIKIFSNYTTVTDNIIISNNDNGIYLSYSNGNNITDNEIYDNNKGIYQKFSSDNIITGNTIISNKHNGINLDYSNGNNITDNKIYDSYAGIYISSFNINNTIAGNNISNNNMGIWLGSTSHNNIIIGNNISNNDEGILVHFMYGSNIIIGNNISNNCWGVILDRGNITIINNSFFNNGLFVIPSYDNNIEKRIVEDNIVNGKPLVYLKDESDKVIDYEVGQVILVNCDNIVVENLNLSYATVGIELCRTNNSTIQNNDCSNNYYGIYSISSSNNTITGNNISNNDEGISLSHYSDNNVIYHNNFIENIDNAYDEGNNIWDDGKYGNYWSDYKEKYPDAKPKLFKPWMWNTPYGIEGGNSKDNCPLIKEWPKTFSKTIPRDKSTSSPLFMRFLEPFPLLNLLLQRLRI